MAITTQTTCDICGKEKKAVNHWWIADKIRDSEAWGIMPWSEEQSLKSGRIHLCGQQCAVKALSD